MGGGTGTGAAPIIAKMAKDLDILTVGIVTMPFQFEGKMRNEQAQIGIEKLRAEVDSLVVINNNKLREVYGNLGFKAGFSKADEVLATAARGIAEVITHHYTQNIDLRDAKTVLSNSGTAIMGSAAASGQNRAHEAISKALDSPLLNDNKITGAKNVLLLIVSGAQEITIDEIGEINDHIQNEAGHGANIIMGVGEDESLEESIAVTVIATGFDVEQQNEISNTEAKKVIHALEDDQNMEQDLSGDQVNPAIILPNIELEEKKETPIVKHTLEIEEEEEVTNETLSSFEMDQIKKQSVDERDMIPTSEFIKNLNVTYYEVDVNLDENQEFNITSTAKEEAPAPIEEEQDKQQIMLSFDMPISEKEPTAAPVTEEDEGPIVMDLSDSVTDLEVNDFVEVIPVTENSETGEKRYALDDYEVMESAMNPETEVKQEEEIVFEKKTVETEAKPEEVEGEVDPMNTPISELLKSRAEERRQKMKNFNYKFNNSKIDDIEKVPAYKRQGLELDDRQHSSDTNISRTTLGVDENDDIQLRNNNSFLHDNVD